MTIDTGLIIWGMVIVGIIYSIKRGFDLYEYKIKNKEISPIIVSGTRVEKNKEFYNRIFDKLKNNESEIIKAKDDNKDLDKTLELNF